MEERQRIANNEILRRVNAAAHEAGYRAALEALFAPKDPTAPPTRVPAPHSSARHVSPSAPRAQTPEDSVRKALVARLLEVEGRAEIARAADAYFAAGFELPMDQPVLLKLLEHTDEARVRDALAALDRMLATQPAARRTILDARVRRLEEHAEERATRELATRVRRRVLGSTLTLGAR